MNENLKVFFFANKNVSNSVQRLQLIDATKDIFKNPKFSFEITKN